MKFARSWQSTPRQWQPPPARASRADDAAYAFRSPSGNVECKTFPAVDGRASAICAVTDHTWAAPPRPPDCHMNWGARLSLTQGSAAAYGCYHQEFGTAEDTLGYGQTHSIGTITCDSEPNGVTCSDSTTGHFFLVSRDSYQL